MSINIERYQFPQITNDEWDSNWLIVAGCAELDTKSWKFRDPCLTTFEVEHLANWLDQVFFGTAEKPHCSFTEPNLDFQKVSDREVRIAFWLEAQPPWCDADSDFRDIGFSVPIDNGLPAAAKSLRAQLERFPIRALKGS